MIIPPLFRCPISLDLFQDPVTLCTGQTYDRTSIEKWLSAGNSRCPITMQNLHDTSLVPNHTLRHFIHQWLISHSHTTITAAATPLDFATIKKTLHSDQSSLDKKVQTLHTISQSQSQDLPLAISLFELVLELILKNGQSSILVEKALFIALKLLPFTGTAPLTILKEEANYASFLLLLQSGNVQIKKSTCLIVEAISLCPETKHFCDEKLVRIIIDIVQSGEEAGVRAAWALSFNEPNRSYMVRLGAVDRLIPYLLSGCGEVAAIAMSTVENMLCVGPAAKDAILKHVKAVVKMVFRVSEHRGSESAVNSLIIICSDCVIGREMAIVEGILTQLLLLLQSQCDARIKTKARTLLKLLRG